MPKKEANEIERLTAELKATQENEQRLVDANKPVLADKYRLQARVETLEGAVTRALKRRGCKHPNCQAAMNILAATEQGEGEWIPNGTDCDMNPYDGGG